MVAHQIGRCWAQVKIWASEIPGHLLVLDLPKSGEFWRLVLGLVLVVRSRLTVGSFLKFLKLIQRI